MRRYLSLVVGVLVAATCLRLGVWQLDRLAQRRARNAVTTEHLAEPVLGLDDSTARLVASSPDSFRFRRTTAVGTFDFGRQLVVLAQSHGGLPGIHVVTPLLLSGSMAVLVERGWVPSPDGRSLDTAWVAEPESTVVVGVLLRSEARRVGASSADTWPRAVLSADPDALARFYPYRLLPLLLRRDSLPAGMANLRAVSIPELSNGPHLSYAIQW
ncbi:MAG: SURF1 family protein, partial [Gemmatimonadales bacterium]|nr:SURF1 family protein [Gemmatimonadales bacterium]